MRKNGFTFIELIVSISILVIIIASIYSAFNTGLRIYKKSSTGQDLQKIRTTLLKIDKELKGAFFFSKIPFKGAASEVIFPLVIVKQNIENIYIVSYYAEKDKNRDSYKIIRKEKLFTDNPQDKKEEIKDMFSAVSIRFEYAYKSNDPSKNYEWQEAWGEEQKTLPLAVRIYFKIDDTGEIYSKVIFLMQGALGSK